METINKGDPVIYTKPDGKQIMTNATSHPFECWGKMYIDVRGNPAVLLDQVKKRATYDRSVQI